VLEPVFEADFEPVSYGFRSALLANIALSALDEHAQTHGGFGERPGETVLAAALPRGATR